MRRLRNHLIGVDQGNQNLFSDFENGGEMWAGTGDRESRTRVKFKEAFKTCPVVQVSLAMWDMDQKTNQRADLSAENVSKTGFDIIFKTWGNTKVARVRASWIAIGEIRGDDEWDVG